MKTGQILQRLRRANMLDRVLNVLLVVACIAFTGMLIKWNTTRYSRSERPSVITGKRLDIAQVRWGDARRTLVFMLSTNCHFCTESVPFYRQLIHEPVVRSAARILALFPQTTNEAREYLHKMDLPIDEVYQSDITALGFYGTPTVLLIDETGVIMTAWVGKPDYFQQTAMLNAVSHLSTEKLIDRDKARLQLAVNHSGDKSSMPREKDVDVDAILLEHMIQNKAKLVLLDIDSREQFQRGHVPSAKNIPIDELETRAENELSLKDKIVLYCRCTNDSTSRNAYDLLAAQGYTQVSILRGGLGEWMKATHKPDSKQE